MLRIGKSLILLAVCIAALTACGGNDVSLSSQAGAAQSKQFLRSEKTLASDVQSQVQTLFIAYFGRPAAPAGLAYWISEINNGDSLDQVGSYFSHSPELLNQISGLNPAALTQSTANALVTNFFINLFGRQPLPAGLTYWTNTLLSGAITINNLGTTLVNSASSGDSATIANKVAVANYFTAQITTLNAANGYNTATFATAQTMLRYVTAASDATAFESSVDATIAALLSPTNVQPIIVDLGPDPVNAPALDEVFTSVTICAPANPAICQTIDHVLVDTGSSGLRIISSVLNSDMQNALQAQTTSGSNTLVECTQFVDGYSWGPIRSVNFQVAGESVPNMPMQVIIDPNQVSNDQYFASLANTTNCVNSGPSENTVDSFGANGVLGVGLFQQDCGAACVASSAYGYYYTCSSSSCTATSATLAQQVPNPVSLFSWDNNGVIISLPSVASGGAASVGGTMTFGVGTQSNNTLGSAAVYQMDPAYGEFTTIFAGVQMTESYIDSGSNGLYFPNLTGIAVCSSSDLYAGFFCPATTQNLSAIMLQNPNNVTGTTINFSIANANAALATNPDYAVYVPIGAPNIPALNTDYTYSFDWGLPFFFGRNVFVVTENKTVGNQTGPFMAF
jgi:hypothetical protein